MRHLEQISKEIPDDERGQAETIMGATFGMPSFMLAFTFELARKIHN